MTTSSRGFAEAAEIFQCGNIGERDVSMRLNQSRHQTADVPIDKAGRRVHYSTCIRLRMSVVTHSGQPFVIPDMVRAVADIVCQSFSNRSVAFRPGVVSE